MKTRIITALSTISTIFISWTGIASAHVVVAPKSAQTAQSVLFSISVPNERQSSMTSLKLAVPSGVSEVMPTALAGWTVATEKSGDNVSAITWNGGELPAGQRLDLTFKAQTPEKAGELDWKAYQTFADGSQVSWDQKPAATEKDDDSAASGPYSVTAVSAEAPAPAADSTLSSQNSTVTSVALGISLLALILSIFSLARRISVK